MLDKDTAIKYAKQYAKELLKILKPTAVVLYGSYSKGNYNNDSDIDVAVIFNGYDGNWIEDSKILWKLAHKTCLEIEPILLDSAKDKSGFVADVYKNGTIIYKA